MTKHVLAGVAAFVLMTGIASAQNYPPALPPTPVAPPPPVSVAPPPSAPVAPPPAAVPPPLPAPDGDYRASTVHKGVDTGGNEFITKDTYREGVEGSTETHTETKTNPETGTTTRSTTTTSHE
jgi:hypothetical protein